MNTTGPKLGWLLGGIGGLIWLPVMAVIWLAQGKMVGAIVGFIIFALGVLYLFMFRPWRYAHVQLRVIYLGLLAFLLIGAVVVIWQYYEPETFTARNLLPGLALIVLLLPMLTLGNKTWSDLHTPQPPQ